MPRSTIIRTVSGLALILVLGVGGYLRWRLVEQHVWVAEPISPSYSAQMTCQVSRKDLRTLPKKATDGLVFKISQPLSTWAPEMNMANPSFWGETMGTSFSVQITGKTQPRELAQIIQNVEDQLAEINRQMSTWIPNSEISCFNQSESTELFQASEGIVSVVKRSLELSASTGGAFDPTLQPLLNLWGFGSGGKERRIPTDAEITKAKALTGWRHLGVDGTSNLRKDIPELQLALGAIAKGYGVDAVARLLKQAGLANWFVEIGGEVVVQGLNPKGVPWRIGIQYPTTNPMDDRLQGIVNLSAGAVATSGDYRNYIEQDGVVYSHILDPRSGRAVLSDTASVTVTAPDCTLADGIATALFVMGATEGLAWVEQRPGVEAMFLLRGANGELFEKFSSGFAAETSYSHHQ